MRFALIAVLTLMLTASSEAQIVLDAFCSGEDFTGTDHKTKTMYFGFCEYDDNVSILDTKTRTYFNGFCQDGILQATNAKTGQKITGTCSREN